MLNKIWFGLLCIGIVYGFAKAAYQSRYPTSVDGAELPAVQSSPAVKSATTQTPTEEAKKRPAPEMSEITAAGKRLNDAVFDAAKSSIEICIGLIGLMALWLGLLNVAKDSGLVDTFARLMNPLFRLLFPEVPKGHPAQSAMLMNFAANMLGLDNAATPLGIKAMEELQTLNPVKDTATNSMALFLAINCGSITLIPFTVIGLRAINGSKNPSEIIIGTWIASAASVVAGIAIARLLARSSRFAVVPDASPATVSIESPTGNAEDNL